MLGKLFGTERKPSLRIVVGLNQVDKMRVDGWNERLNMPTEEAEKEIERRLNDITKKLAKFAEISPSQIEYYSALKRYRLLHLLNKIIKNAYAGFKLDDVQPTDPFELAEEDVREFAEQERQKRQKTQKEMVDPKEILLDKMKQILSVAEFGELEQKLTEEKRLPPKIAVMGKAGVGKTTTINNVFNAKWKTSHTVVGTTEAHMKEFNLDSGGVLNIVDLPGYGRSITEDREYEKIYQDMIPSCDLVLLVIQANSRDLADDQEMLFKIVEWLKKIPNTAALEENSIWQ
ncbi:MAG: hypothetical protein HC880_09135 [Bacteroidia bacterium]|nr:hypothetical protein [Bacteroidia bacterium]